MITYYFILTFTLRAKKQWYVFMHPTLLRQIPATRALLGSLKSFKLAQVFSIILLSLSFDLFAGN